MRRILILGVATAALIAPTPGLSPFALATSVKAAGQADPATPQTMRVAIAPNRALSLTCMGAGRVTVLLDAGGSDWSSIWSTIQPRIAVRTRVCSYDRAGLGRSDADSGPRTPVAIVEDLQALIAKAPLRGPIVLVGHSLGGFNVKLYAALHPREIAGLVLLDPSEERSWDRTRAALSLKYGAALATRAELLDASFLVRLTDRFGDCAAAARDKGFEPGSIQYRRCTDPDRPQLAPPLADERRAIMGTAGYQAAQASEIVNSVYGPASPDAAYARLFRPGALRDMALVVLTHQEPASDDPIDRLGTEQGILLHRQTAALSTRGSQRMVARSSHYLQFDQPDTVVAAIEQVVAAAAARR